MLNSTRPGEQEKYLEEWKREGEKESSTSVCAPGIGMILLTFAAVIAFLLSVQVAGWFFGWGK